jgi:hypothetical protein
MATKNRPGAFDCYANAKPDEPMFVLLGRDPMAGSLVREWAWRREAIGEDPVKVAEAKSCAEQLDAWARNLGKRLDGNRRAAPPGEMLRIREVRGVRLRNGEEWMQDATHWLVMYDDGVQHEKDGGATLFDWEQILEVLV